MGKQKDIELESIDTEKISKKESETQKLNVFHLFRFADGLDVFLQSSSALCSIIAGLLVPGAYIIFGDITDTFVDFGYFANCINNDVECFPSSNITNNYQASFECPDINGNDPAATSNLTCLFEIFADCMKEPGNSSELLELINEICSQADIFDTMVDYAILFCYVGVGAWIAAWIGTSLSMISAARQAKKMKIAYFQSILRQEVAFYDTVDAAVISQQLTDETKKIQDAIGEKLSTSIKGQCHI